jgi:hypothetical protein
MEFCMYSSRQSAFDTMRRFFFRNILLLLLLPATLLDSLSLAQAQSPQTKEPAKSDVAAIQQTPDERTFFDFLICDWTIEKAERPAGTELGGDDVYKFQRAFEGGGILGDWYFNRGTKQNLNTPEESISPPSTIQRRPGRFIT